MSRSRRHRLVVSTLLALTFLAGCPAPGAPPGTGKKPGGAGGRGQAIEVAGSVPGTEAPPGEQPAGAGSSGPGGAAAGAAGATAVAGAAPLDPQKFLLGRVFAPSGILSNNGGSVIGGNTASVIGQNTANIVSNNGGSVIGGNTASIVSNNGGSVIGGNTASVIGQNTANVIGQNTANIVSNNGGSVIGGNTASIVSNNGGSLGQRPLAYAKLRVVDAAGKPKNGKNGQPLVGQADAWGQFYVPREEIDANSVIEVESPEIKGQLKAFVAKGAQTPEKELEVDMVSTLATTYILEEFVKGEQGIFERLTPEIEAEAREDVKSAIKDDVNEVIKSTELEVLVSVVDALIRLDSSVMDVFKRIEELLILVGIQNDGAGLLAIEVPLAKVDGILPTPEGIYVFTGSDHRLRLIDTTGKVENVITQSGWPYSAVIPAQVNAYHSGMGQYNGWLYLSDTYNHRIIRVKNGVVEVVVGDGKPGSAVEGALASNSSISFPTGLTISDDGTIYFSSSGENRVKRVTTSGVIETVVGGGLNTHASVPMHPLEVKLFQPQGMALDGKDGLLIADCENDIVRRFSLKEKNVVDVVSQYGIVAPMSIACASERIFVSGLGNDPLFEIKESSVSPINLRGQKDSAGKERRFSSPHAIGAIEGRVYVQQANSVVTELSGFEPITIRDIASRPATGGDAALTKAVQMAINTDGEIAIADENGRRVHIKRGESDLVTVAGNGNIGFVRSALDALYIPIGEVVDLTWESEGTLVFVTRDDRPNVKRLTVGGRIETIIGNSLEGSDPPQSGVAVNVSLARPSEIFKVSDSEIGLIDSGNLYVLRKDGYLDLFKGWSTVKVPRKVSFSGGRHVMLDAGSNSIVSVKNGVATELVSQSELISALGDDTIQAIHAEGTQFVFFGSKEAVFQKSLKSGVMRQLAGVGGLVFNQQTRDTSIQSLKDIGTLPSGELVILEADQVKVVPVSKINME